MLGTSETSRWLNLALFQGAPSKKGLKTLVRVFISRSYREFLLIAVTMVRLWRHRQILC